VVASLDTLLAGAVDYAGLFPPAALDMPAAASAYAEHRRDPASALLGRFVVPVLRLPELELALHATQSLGGGRWPLSALTGVDPGADVRVALEFNARNASDIRGRGACIEALESRVSTVAEIEAAMSRMPGELGAYFEIPIADDPDSLVSALRRTGGRAKARSGGVTEDAFPPADHLARFLLRCRDARVPCKFTAGLHHPIRGRHRLTYAPDAPVGTMYGYLNVFVAAALAWAGEGEAAVLLALREPDAAAFHLTAGGLHYHTITVSTTMLGGMRSDFLHSFGSCSFREPVDELAALSLT